MQFRRLIAIVVAVATLGLAGCSADKPESTVSNPDAWVIKVQMATEPIEPHPATGEMRAIKQLRPSNRGDYSQPGADYACEFGSVEATRPDPAVWNDVMIDAYDAYAPSAAHRQFGVFITVESGKHFSPVSMILDTVADWKVDSKEPQKLLDDQVVNLNGWNISGKYLILVTSKFTRVPAEIGKVVFCLDRA